MKAIERLFEYFDYKGIRPARFERICGLSNGYLSLTLKRKGDIGSKIVEKIINNCPDLSQEWLMMGKGEMIKVINTSEDGNVKGDDLNELDYIKMKLQLTEELIKGKDKLIEFLEEKIKELETRK